MDSNKKSNILKLATLLCAAAACALRFAYYAFGTDGRGLLIPNHWSLFGLWGVCIGFAAVLLVLGSSITARKVDAPQPASPLGAAGSALLGAALLIAGLSSFGDFLMTADLLIWALGLCAGFSMLIIAFCRFTGRKPYFLLHATACLYITLRTVSVYRQWSSDPQLQDYGFYIAAHAALMIASYHHAAFDAGLGNHRALWICSLSAVFLSCAALPRCESWLLMAAFALWAFTGLTVLPVRKRRIRPTAQVDEL